MKLKYLPLTLLTLTILSLGVRTAVAQGSLTPPGAPASTMRTLLQIEPRTPISALPFTIASPGSYYVTTNLTGVSGTNGITITTSNVVLDLRDFTLFGVPGSSNGVDVAGNFSDVTVQNGTVTAWGGVGVYDDTSSNGHFRRLNLVANGSDGIDPGVSAQLLDCVSHDNVANGFGGFCSRCKFERCTSHENQGQGFSTYERCVFQECSATDNGLDGYNPFFDCSMLNCLASDNGFDGFDVGYSGCSFIHCTAAYNGAQGILTGDNCTIIGCTTIGSGLEGIVAGVGCVIESCAANANSDSGIVASNACLVVHCTTQSNTNLGISVNAHSQVRECVACFDSTGITATNDCTISDCTVNNNAANGILANHSCLIENNACQANGGGNTGDGGIRCTGSFNRIDGNHLTENNGNGLYLDSSGNTVIRNSAKSNTSNYNTGSGNDVGPIGSAATSTSPWANLQ